MDASSIPQTLYLNYRGVSVGILSRVSNARFGWRECADHEMQRWRLRRKGHTRIGTRLGANAKILINRADSVSEFPSKIWGMPVGA